MITDIQVMNKEKAGEYIGEKPYIIIGFASPRVKFPKYIGNKNLKGVLAVVADDATRIGKYDDTKLFTKEQAKKILEFVSDAVIKHPDITVIVHCEAGISRSSATAAAIAKCWWGDDTMFFNNRFYIPNMLIYSTLVNLYNASYDEVLRIKTSYKFKRGQYEEIFESEIMEGYVELEP